MNIQKLYTPITEKEIQGLNRAKQIFSDCYLVSTLNSLTRTDSGKKILQKNIQKSLSQNSKEPLFKIHFPNVYNKPRDVFVYSNEIDDLYLVDKYYNIVRHGKEENSILKAVEIAMNKLIDEHPLIKSLISRIPDSVEKFEYNSPSKFMRMFTGKEPISINEHSISNTLKSKTDEVSAILNRIKKSNNNENFVAGTGVNPSFPNLESWHCYVISKVKDNHITLYNQKEGLHIDMSVTTFLKQFKYITGYFSKDLNR